MEKKFNPIKLMAKVWKEKKKYCFYCCKKIRLFTPIFKVKNENLNTDIIKCFWCWLDEQKRERTEKER